MFLKKKFGAWFSGCFSDTCQCEVKKIFTAKKMRVSVANLLQVGNTWNFYNLINFFSFVKFVLTRGFFWNLFGQCFSVNVLHVFLSWQRFVIVYFTYHKKWESKIFPLSRDTCWRWILVLVKICIYYTLHKEWNFSLRILSVNWTKSLVENFIFCAFKWKRTGWAKRRI